MTGDVHCECLVGAPAASRECECACDAPPEGTLYVNGRLRADAIVGYASKIYAGEIACRALVDGTELRTWDTVVDASGEPRRQLGLVPSTCRASDVLEGSVLEDEAGRLPDRGLGSSPSLAARQVPRPRRSTPCASAMGSTDLRSVPPRSPATNALSCFSREDQPATSRYGFMNSPRFSERHSTSRTDR